MWFKPDRNKQAPEILFLRKARKVFFFYLNLCFNDQSVDTSVAQKSLGLNLDEKLPFINCNNDKVDKILKNVGFLHKLSMLLPQKSLLTIYKSLKKEMGWTIFRKKLQLDCFLW